MNGIILSLLKQARLSSGMKQKEVGEKLGVKGNTIGNYENGITEPDIDTFVKLCALYGLNYTNVLEAAYGKAGNESLDAREINLIKKYRQLDADGKEEIDDIINLKLAKLQRKAEADEANCG